MGSETNHYDAVYEVPLWIDNEPVYSDEKFEVISALNQRTIWKASSANQNIVEKVVASSSKAFPSWSSTHPADRRRIFFRAAEIIRARRDEIISIMINETSCSKEWATGINFSTGVDVLEELGSLATSSLNGWLPTTESKDRLGLVFKEPYGVVLGIAPWNAPLLLAIRAVATPIICGNTAILKASELSPRTHQFLGELFRDAGLPPGVLNIIQHSRKNAAEVTNTLIAHPSVRKINFTGSTAVGRIIAAEAGRHLKPVLLELGGKASCVVLEDADLSKAAKAAVIGAFVHHGQVCMGTERVIVVKSVAQKLISELKKAAEDFPAGTAVNVQGAERTQSLVEAAVKAGANLEYGEVSRSHATLKPTILSHVSKDMDIFYTESFGPTLVVASVETDEDAIKLANDTEYGLSACIFSRNVVKAIQLARTLETGACHINAMTVHDEPSLPHGGYKSSGFGRFGAQWGIDEFLQVKTITVLQD